MKVRELMQRQVTTVDAHDDLASALQIMLWSGIRHLPVLEDGAIAGVLTQRDVLARRGGNGAGWRLLGSVGDAMSKPAQTASADEDVENAAARMSVAKLGCLPVMDGEELVGILTTSDLVAHLAQQSIEVPATPRVAADVMTADPVTTAPEAMLTEAAAALFERGVRHLPVVDDDGRVVGMLSDRDVRSAFGNPLLGKLRKHMSVDAAMSRTPQTVRDTSTLDEISRRLVDARVGAVAVVDDDSKLVGIVSYLDLLRHVR